MCNVIRIDQIFLRISGQNTVVPQFVFFGYDGQSYQNIGRHAVGYSDVSEFIPVIYHQIGINLRLFFIQLIHIVQIVLFKFSILNCLLDLFLCLFGYLIHNHGRIEPVLVTIHIDAIVFLNRFQLGFSKHSITHNEQYNRKNQNNNKCNL